MTTFNQVLTPVLLTSMFTRKTYAQYSFSYEGVSSERELFCHHYKLMYGNNVLLNIELVFEFDQFTYRLKPVVKHKELFSKYVKTFKVESHKLPELLDQVSNSLNIVFREYGLIGVIDG